MHGEPIPLEVDIANESSKTVKNVELKVRQFTTIRTTRGLPGTTLKADIFKAIYTLVSNV
jgi:hypothetical protein